MGALLSSLSDPQTAVLMGIGVDAQTLTLFEDCFRPLGVDIRAVRMHTEQDLDATRFDGCLIRLDEWSADILTRIRQSSLNAGALVYGLGPLKLVAELAHFCLTAVVEKCTEEKVKEIVLASHLLLVHRFRRSLRLPLVVPVQIESAEPTITAFTKDISSGGLTIAGAGPVPKALRLQFALPDGHPLRVPAIVCWRAGDNIGVQLMESPDLGHIEEWLQFHLGTKASMSQAESIPSRRYA